MSAIYTYAEQVEIENYFTEGLIWNCFRNFEMERIYLQLPALLLSGRPKNIAPTNQWTPE